MTREPEYAKYEVWHKPKDESVWYFSYDMRFESQHQANKHADMMTNNSNGVVYKAVRKSRSLARS